MNIIVKQYQSTTISTIISTIKERMLGWCKEDQSFYYKEGNNTIFGLTKRIPSIIGNGLYSTITIPNNTFIVGDFVRLTTSGFTSAVSTSANDKLATHFIFDVDNDNVSVANSGSWVYPNLNVGPVYLSTSANKITQAYTGIEQTIGSYDGARIHLSLNTNYQNTTNTIVVDPSINSILVSGSSYTITQNDNGKRIIFNSVSACNINLIDNSLSDGFNFMAKNILSGQMKVVSNGTSTLVGSGIWYDPTQYNTVLLDFVEPTFSYIVIGNTL